MTDTLKEGVYYLFYKDSENPKRCYIGIKYPGIDSTPFIIIGGRRSRELYNFILQLLDNNGIKYSIIEEGSEKTVELPLATGLATSIFLLAVYSSLKPLKYAASLEKMILGKMPFTKYFVIITQLATELSNYLERRNKQYSKQALNKEAAKTVSKMLIQLIKGIQ
ncbi:MAG: hypothetical protein DRJ59_03075 [Thermoprotei archaeon]|nr:MAG: hypothetical protein DRJ59_03075 [Thermoprotei archaeon]